MGGCQNYGPFLILLGTRNITCRTVLGTHKGTLILTTTHMHVCMDTLGNPSKLPLPDSALEAKERMPRALRAQRHGWGLKNLKPAR